MVWHIIERQTGLRVHQTSNGIDAAYWAAEHDPDGDYDFPFKDHLKYEFRVE